MDDETAITLQFKGEKSVLEFIVPTRHELESCTHYDMTNDAEWNPKAVDLQSLRKIYQVKKKKPVQYIMSNAIQCTHFRLPFPTTHIMCLHVKIHFWMKPS